MNLRTLSIKLSVFGMLIIGGTYGWFLLDRLFGDTIDAIFVFLMYYVFNGFPLMINMAISVYSRHLFSHILSATTSLLYTLAFALTIIGTFYGVYDGPAVILVWILWLTFLPILLPLLIITLVIELRHRKKKPKEQ